MNNLVAARFITKVVDDLYKRPMRFIDINKAHTVKKLKFILWKSSPATRAKKLAELRAILSKARIQLAEDPKYIVSESYHSYRALIIKIPYAK